MASRIIEHIKRQVHQKNRNFVGAFVGRVGTGKSYCCLKVATEVYPKFDVNKHLYFDILKLVDDIQENKLEVGTAIVFDEAGISVSNRQSYMNKFNKAMSFLLQTWRHRNIVLFLTVPDISFMDKGVRKMCDALIECQKVVKSRNVVQVKWKWIQINQQKGDMYFHGVRGEGGRVLLEIGKPNIKTVRAYEKKKTEFTTNLYLDIKEHISPAKQEKIDKVKEERKCAECGMLALWLPTKGHFRCRGCGNTWARSTPKPQHIGVTQAIV